MSDDDLIPDSPVVSALRAPATADELTGEAAALAMFRASAAPRRRTRALRRIGVGGAGIVLGLGLTGGVAAAYTTGLPDPVQNALHSAIEPLGLPAPPTAHVRRLRQKLHRQLQQARIAHSPLSRPDPSPRHTTPSRPSTPPASAVVPPPTPGRSPAPSPSSTNAPPPPALSAAVSRNVVPVHSGVVLSGRLTRGSKGVAGRHVYAAEIVAGTSSWRRVAEATTGSDGTVSLTVPPLTSNVRLRLVTGAGVTSRQVPVAVVPNLSVRVARSRGQRVATVTADGGRPGDALVLLRRDGSGWTKLATSRLDSSSTGTFTVPGPGSRRVRYRVRLPATGRHAASFAEFVVAAR